MSEKPAKVYLWTQPRSVSTAFFRAIGNHPNCQLFFEPYCVCCHLAPDRKSQSYKLPVNPEISFEKKLHSMELPYADKDLVFVKDMSYALQSRSYDLSLLPKGYKHTFLIRNPRKQLSSMFKLGIKEKGKVTFKNFDPKEAGMEDTYKLYEIVTKILKQNTIVIDTDDLLNDPEGILRLYCDHVGIEYCDEMVNWRADHGLEKTLEDWGSICKWAEWFETAFSTTCFDKRPTVTSNNENDITHELPAVYLQAIEHSMPFYWKLYEKRTTVKSNAPN